MGNSFRDSNHATEATQTKHGLWVALAIAFALHVLILLLPIPHQSSDISPVITQIEIRLNTLDQQPITEKDPQPIELPVPEPERPPEETIETEQLVKTTAPEVQQIPPAPPLDRPEKNLDQMSTEEKRRLTHSILSSQFITEESTSNQLFGKPVNLHMTDVQKEFHFPEKSDMLAMLDQPMQDLPFEYTPGLVYFAYDPGVKGDLQRFWDEITPEFGWITRYGTEVKCVWVLVIVGCGWK